MAQLQVVRAELGVFGSDILRQHVDVLASLRIIDRAMNGMGTEMYHTTFHDERTSHPYPLLEEAACPSTPNDRKTIPRILGSFGAYSVMDNGEIYGELYVAEGRQNNDNYDTVHSLLPDGSKAFEDANEYPTLLTPRDDTLTRFGATIIIPTHTPGEEDPTSLAPELDEMYRNIKKGPVVTADPRPLFQSIIMHPAVITSEHRY